MQNNSASIAKLARGVLVAAVIACAGTALTTNFPNTEIAGLSDPIRLARPLGDSGDNAIRDMPVVGGRSS